MSAYEGIGVAPGIAVGTVFVLDREDFAVHKETIDADKVDSEIDRFETAIDETRGEILVLQKNLRAGLGDEYWKIFNAHLWMLDDAEFRNAVTRHIRDDLYNAEYALTVEVENLTQASSAIEDPYLRERIADIRDVSRRILHRLLGHERQNLRHLKEPTIVVSHDLMPSDTAQMDREHIVGLATDVGGRTSHTAILARALELPAVVGLKHISFEVRTGDRVIVDGNRGVVIVNPDPATLAQYNKEKKDYIRLAKTVDKTAKLPAETVDGFRITLAANIELPEELPHAIRSGAEGIGLYRTEYLFLGRDTLPTEDEQFEAYRDVVERMKPNKVVIRTLDIGGDKLAKNIAMPQEGNPQMGWRAIRLCLEEPDLFMAQLRAILRATAYGSVSIMYPLISRIDELQEANRLLDAAKSDLRRINEPFDDQVEIGIMIEVPSAALMADILARRCDFLSIGTNDLLQYSLAVDRGNARIAHLYEPSNPGVLRLIKSVIDAGHANGCWVGVCGEMASAHEYAALFVGMGIDELSVSTVSISAIRSAIRAMKKSDAEELVREVMACETGTEVHEVLDRMLAEAGVEVPPFLWNT